MQKDIEHLSEELKRLADNIRETGDVSELKNLKTDLLRVYEELVVHIRELESRPEPVVEEPPKETPSRAAEEKKAQEAEDQEYPTLSDLFGEQGYHAPIAAQYIAEPHDRKFRETGVVELLHQMLRNSLGGTHDARWIDGLIRRNQHKSVNACFQGDFGDHASS